jgi:hypothetical protein
MLASSTTTEEPRPWLGTRSEPRAQSRWPECTPRSRATTPVARTETTRPVRRAITSGRRN